jgi:hypothetical protein
VKMGKHHEVWKLKRFLLMPLMRSAQSSGVLWWTFKNEMSKRARAFGSKRPVQERHATAAAFDLEEIRVLCDVLVVKMDLSAR